MSKQLLEIDPHSELIFVGPFNVPVTTHMKLTNSTNNRIVYKIKTTAPKRYCVRPNSGILEPKNSEQIIITFQPPPDDSNEKVKHKFMVQSFVAPDGDLKLETLWKELDPDMLMDTKLKCIFKESENETKSSLTPETKKPTDNKVDPNYLLDIKQLREEESRLQKENFQLREEILKLKQQVTTSQQFTNKYQPPPLQADMNSSFYLGLALVMGFIGIVLGKFIL